MANLLSVVQSTKEIMIYEFIGIIDLFLHSATMIKIVNEITCPPLT